MLHLVTVVALVRHFGGDNKALQQAVYDLRPTMPREIQPLASSLMRHARIDLWLDIMLAHYCPENQNNGNE